MRAKGQQPSIYTTQHGNTAIILAHSARERARALARERTRKSPYLRQPFAGSRERERERVASIPSMCVLNIKAGSTKQLQLPLGRRAFSNKRTSNAVGTFLSPAACVRAGVLWQAVNEHYLLLLLLQQKEKKHPAITKIKAGSLRFGTTRMRVP